MNRIDWLNWRKTGIGGSDAPIIMELSSWKTPLQLYEDKIATEIIDTPANYQQQRGIDMEPKIRALFEIMKGESFPANFVQDHDFGRASLDGESVCKKKIVEIKYSGKEDYEKAKEGKVPDKYYPQCQHNLMVSGAEICYFVCYPFEKEVPTMLSSEKLATVEVLPDADYQMKLLKKETEFWDCVTKRTPPPASERDFLPLTGIADIAKSWRKLEAEIKELDERKEKLRKMILDAAEKTGHNRLLCAGIKLSKQTRAGNVDYTKVPELQGVDLEQYRKKSSTFWKMDVTNEI